MGVRHEVGPALREPRRVARTSRRGRRPAGWHRRGSPEPLPFRHRKRLGDVIEAARQASPEIGGGCPAGSRSSGRSGHLPQALPQGIVDGRLEAASVRLLHPPEQGGHVRVEGQGRSHASERRWPDDLMSTGRSAPGSRAIPGRVVAVVPVPRTVRERFGKRPLTPTDRDAVVESARIARRIVEASPMDPQPGIAGTKRRLRTWDRRVLTDAGVPPAWTINRASGPGPSVRCGRDARAPRTRPFASGRDARAPGVACSRAVKGKHRRTGRPDPRPPRPGNAGGRA